MSRKKPPQKKPGGHAAGDSDEDHQRRLSELRQRIEAGLQHGNLSRRQRNEYRKAIRVVLSRLTPAALARVHANGKEFRFYGSHEELTAAIKRKFPAIRIGKGRTLKGMLDRNGTLHLDGSGVLFGRPASIEEFHAHEVVHCLDGTSHDLSETRDWHRAWKAEIADGGFLGPNATRSATEAFSEFGAMLLGSGIPAEAVAEVMPLCVTFWREKGLI